jgi:hypothetical protein
VITMRAPAAIAFALLAVGCSAFRFDGPSPPDPDSEPTIDPAIEIDGAAGSADVPGLIAHFPLDALDAGTGTYSTERRFVAACEAGCPTVTAGRIGAALAFDGTRALRVHEDGSFRTTTGFTVSVWVYPSFKSIATPVSKGFMQPSGVFNSWQFEVTSQQHLAVTTAEQNGRFIDSSGVPLPVQTWTHLAITWDGAIVRLFMDGVARLERARTIAFDGGDIVIGGDENDGELDAAYFFDGALDDLRIYDRALDSAEIAVLASP